jgi:transposase InsO family protein
MEERLRFVVLAREGKQSVTQLCAHFGISRKTGYKWLERYAQEGQRGCEDKSRAPHTHPHATPEPVQRALVRLRKAHPLWGPKKLVALLAERSPEMPVPSASTAGAILARAGLVRTRRRVQRPLGTVGGGHVLTPGEVPNQVWCADFKGQFPTRDGHMCWPLTLTDDASRLLLRCEALDNTQGRLARPVFESAFDEYGLPDVIRTDNGSPFCSRSLGGLTPLSAWWVRLGIRVERSRVARPADNGRHERMHRTLKDACCLRPAANHPLQQRAFDAFRDEYNRVRPHEALGQTPPARHYRPSARRLPARLPELDYPRHFHTRVVDAAGAVRLRHRSFHIGGGLAHQPLGLEEFADKRWRLHFAWLVLGELCERTGRITPYGPQSPAFTRGVGQPPFKVSPMSPV